MKTALAAVVVFLLLPVCGCTSWLSDNTYLKDYQLVSPVPGKEPVYEDDQVRVSIKIVNDSMFRLAITNKTTAPMRILWGSSSITTVSGENVPLIRRAVSGNSGPTTLAPNGSVSADVYPAVNAYKDKSGKEQVYPLYCSGSDSGKPGDAAGKTIGVKLVAEVEEHTRLYPIMLVIVNPLANRTLSRASSD